jgi:hypothetical protein
VVKMSTSVLVKHTEDGDSVFLLIIGIHLQIHILPLPAVCFSKTLVSACKTAWHYCQYIFILCNNMYFLLFSLLKKVPRRLYTYQCLKVWKVCQENTFLTARFVFTNVHYIK